MDSAEEGEGGGPMIISVSIVNLISASMTEIIWGIRQIKSTKLYESYYELIIKRIQRVYLPIGPSLSLFKLSAQALKLRSLEI